MDRARLVGALALLLVGVSPAAAATVADIVTDTSGAPSRARGWSCAMSRPGRK